MSNHRYNFDDELVFNGHACYVRQQNYDGTYNVKFVDSEWCAADVKESELARKHIVVRLPNPLVWWRALAYYLK